MRPKRLCNSFPISPPRQQVPRSLQTLMHLTKTLTVLVATTLLLASSSVAHMIPSPTPMDNITEANGHGRKLCTQNCGSATPTPVLISGAGSPSNPSPGSPTVYVTPGAINQQINVIPGSPTTNANPPPAPAPALAPAPPILPNGQVRPPATPMSAVKPSQPSNPGTSGMNFGSLLGGLNPLTGAATMAHEAHGALLGHTGTVPSAYMQGQSGGHGH